MAIVFIVIAAADRLPARADSELIELPIQVQAHGAPCTAGQGVAGVAVTWVDDRDAQVALPAKQFLFECALKAVDTRCGDVLRLAGAVENDGVAQVGAIQRGLQACAVAELAAPLQLVTL